MKPISWINRCKSARNRGRFTDQDVVDATNWPTCACGEQDSRIPRSELGVPLDEVLHYLGVAFVGAVSTDDFDGAERTLAAIDRRAAEIISEWESAGKVDVEL